MYRLYLMIVFVVCFFCFSFVTYAHTHSDMPTDYRMLVFMSADFNETHNSYIKNTSQKIIILAGRRSGRRLRLRYRRK